MRDGAGGPTFLERLDDAARAALLGSGVERRFRRGATVFREGDPGDSVALIVAGAAKAVASTPEGTEVVLSIRGAGELVGELGAVDVVPQPRVAGVVALEDLTCRIVAAADFADLLERHPRAAVELLRMVAGRMRDAERRRVELGAYDTGTRLARLLVELAESDGAEADAGGNVHLAMTLSQRELAGLVGASRESVARALTALRRDGLVTTGRRSIIVHDVGRLREYGT